MAKTLLKSKVYREVSKVPTVFKWQLIIQQHQIVGFLNNTNFNEQLQTLRPKNFRTSLTVLIDIINYV